MTAKGHTQWVRLTINVDNSTAIGEVSNGRTVSEVKYVDVMGRVSDHPFEGVNVVVTRYSDGSVTTVKVKK